MTNTTPRFRAGTVVWGSVLLVAAAVSFSVAVFDLREFRADAVVWIVTGLGAMFVVVSIIALVARTVSGGTAEPELPTSAAPEPEPATQAGTSRVSTRSTTAKTTAKTTATKGQPVD
jgi:hypothetical protein